KSKCTHNEKARCAKGGKHRAMLEDLPDVTEEQKTALKQIREESKKNMQPQRENMRAVKEKLRNLKMAENPNMNEINQLIDESHKLQAQLEKERTAQHMKALSILTPEQREVFDAKRKEKHEKHEKMRKERKEQKQLKEAK
ncbi:MAG: periplasmic heavy metal sensor, partial [Flavobacteriales bacterium]|nr:periplasmic heavy metal sensor [Flavobacteriales bacterium]